MIRLPTHTNRLSGLNCLQSCVLSLSAFVANGLSPGEERIEPVRITASMLACHDDRETGLQSWLLRVFVLPRSSDMCLALFPAPYHIDQESES